uniref:Uncharacterized protein n=1 Tax=Romanomermis culicivorax TaxID=13658 RepID=A0A915K6N7_ROMCU
MITTISISHSLVNLKNYVGKRTRSSKAAKRGASGTVPGLQVSNMKAKRLAPSRTKDTFTKVLC